MTSTELMAWGTEWARQQEFLNGRFVSLDRATAAVLDEHWHTPPAAQLAEADTGRERLRFGYQDGATFCNGRRIYSLSERAEAVRLHREDDLRPSAVALKMGIPLETVRSWLRRAMTRDNA